MDGIWVLMALLSVTTLWYAAMPLLTALRLARYGILHVPALVLGVVQLWVGGLLGLAAARRALDGRFVVAGALVAAAVLFGVGFL